MKKDFSKDYLNVVRCERLNNLDEVRTNLEALKGLADAGFTEWNRYTAKSLDLFQKLYLAFEKFDSVDNILEGCLDKTYSETVWNDETEEYVIKEDNKDQLRRAEKTMDEICKNTDDEDLYI